MNKQVRKEIVPRAAAKDPRAGSPSKKVDAHTAPAGAVEGDVSAGEDQDTVTRDGKRDPEERGPEHATTGRERTDEEVAGNDQQEELNEGRPIPGMDKKTNGT
jgi:hypothetical protein